MVETGSQVRMTICGAYEIYYDLLKLILVSILYLKTNSGDLKKTEIWMNQK